MHGQCVFHFVVLWTFRWSSYLLNSLLSFVQKVRLNHFLSRSHEDFLHTFFFFLSTFLLSLALLFSWMIFVSVIASSFCSGVFSCCRKSLITSSMTFWVFVRDLIILFFSVNSFCKNAMFLWRASIFLFSWPRDIFVCSKKDSIWFLSIESSQFT